MRDLAPIIKALFKEKLVPFLLILQIAVTFMVMVNAVNMISEREKLMSRPTGVDEENAFYVLTNLQGPAENYIANLSHDLASLRAIEGVEAVSPLNGVPLGLWGNYTSVYPNLDTEYPIDVAGYYGSDEHIVENLGLTLIAGDNLTLSDTTITANGGHNISSNILITKAFAELVSPEDWRQAVGQTVYTSNTPQRIKGIVEAMQGAWPRWYGVNGSIIYPVIEVNNTIRYFVRAEPGQLDNIMEEVNKVLLNTPGRVIEKMLTMEEVRLRAYKDDNASSKLLISVCIGLLLATSLGIYGQARFSVNRRKRQIGTRRALGASRGQVMRFFMLENAVVSITGLVIGFIAALSLSEQFVQHFGLTPVPLPYLLSGMAALFVLGQLSVSYPALQASRVEPAIATRSA